jgi:uncharacterized protein (TIGR02145 family)
MEQKPLQKRGTSENPIAKSRNKFMYMTRTVSSCAENFRKMQKLNFNRAKAHRFLSKAFCSVMIAMAIVSFASCEKETENDPTTDVGVVINGVKWATRNVDAVGAFVATPESTGCFYQWNRKLAYPATGEVTGWDSSTPSGTTWEKANDPSPAGWRVPTKDELKSLLDADKVRNEWTTQKGVSGRKFTDKATGKSIFLPAAGHRSYSGGTLRLAGTDGTYWSSTKYNNSSAYSLTFDSDLAVLDYDFYRRYGLSIRPVSE